MTRVYYPSMAAVFAIGLTSIVRAAPGDPLNGIDISLIDKSTGRPTGIFAGGVGALEFSLTQQFDRGIGELGITDFLNTGLESLTPSLNPVDVGYRQSETYSASENLELDLFVRDPATDAEFNASYTFVLDTVFGQTLELTSITDGGTTYHYDLEITQMDTVLPDLLIGNLGMPGANWTLSLALTQSTTSPSSGTGLNSLLPGGDELTEVDFLVHRALEIQASNVTGEFYSAVLPIDMPRTTELVPDPATLALLAVGTLVLRPRRLMAPATSM